MLPTLSRLSVSYCPAGRLRHRCSSGSLRIPPLHPEFHLPLQCSSQAVCTADPGLSPGLSPHTYSAAYAPFTPSDLDNARTLCITAAAGTELAGASSPGTVRALEKACSSRATGVYTPKCFIPHAASLRQAFAHCAIFPTAASRRSLGRVAVPMWLAILSDQLPVNALVRRYRTN